MRTGPQVNGIPAYAPDRPGRTTPSLLRRVRSRAEPVDRLAQLGDGAAEVNHEEEAALTRLAQRRQDGVTVPDVHVLAVGDEEDLGEGALAAPGLADELDDLAQALQADAGLAQLPRDAEGDQVLEPVEPVAALAAGWGDAG